ncbi:Sirohydrochlorin cobaltochelatase CbiKP [Fundidesulfovibrio magnetotacticus]|uniref:Sirohydrochlorin cobaltochelatase CbiKP n=1 Tax=Fundidesulfovibrio magnetotacticus TaxID=2730080 RepID=A0A6V8LSL3_9BACT|nr:sirohydrochlorin cobaltochelatase [Fundidesulfovibrio magnetotacticus]GFK94734.1 Sirohydrochlorin cobaltochelatase CbiKP [Fundidesulfovibrio magnetotacticus]
MQSFVHHPRRAAALALCFVLLALAPLALAHGGPKPERVGILLAAFGTTVPKADLAYRNLQKKFEAAFPGVDIRLCYTSSMVRHKLADGKKPVKFDSPAEALAKMADEGFTKVVVQSLQTIPGEEFHALSETARAFSGMPKGMDKVVTGWPLLATADDVEKTARALAALAPAGRRPGEALVFLGHGTKHPANIYYPGLQWSLWKADPLAFVGTVEGVPSQEDVLAALKERGVKKAWLLPLLAVAGDHARNDMAGDEDGSWKSALARAGIEAVPVLKGTADADALAAVWIDHARQALERLR